MNRHEYRFQVVQTVYQHLALKKDFNTLIKINFCDIPVDEYFKSVLNYCRRNMQVIISDVQPLLNKWKFDRLNYVSQAILLVAISEIELKIVDQAIIIDEAIEIAKKYCDDDDYRYINAVIDNYVK